MSAVLEKSGQALLDALLQSRPTGRAARFRTWSLEMVRRAVVRAADPTVHYEFYGLDLALPLADELPRYRKATPGYCDNLRRVAAGVTSRYGPITAVDVGANIGDSVAILAAAGVNHVIAVEPDDRFYALLVQNVGRVPGVRTVKALLADVAGARQGKLQSAGGTGHWRDDGDAPIVPASTIDLLLAEAAVDCPVRLIKTDTDGFDLRIIRGAAHTLESGPVLFFEYDPDMLAGDDGPAFLRWLGDVGYSDLLIWDNTGRLLLGTTPFATSTLADLDRYYRGSPDAYCDIAAFARKDSELAEDLRAQEHRLPLP